MKRKVRSKKFLKELRTLIGALKHMKPGETHILSINANYGHYQLVIGPEKKGDSDEDERSIEIEGEIHHLFVTPDEVRAQPSKNQVTENLKDTVIMRGLHVQLKDPRGDGKCVKCPEGYNGLRAKEYINLAGKAGDEIIEKVESSDEISLETYRLVQEDIIKALKENKRKSLQGMS
jgi:hypothetical protein